MTISVVEDSRRHVLIQYVKAIRLSSPCKIGDNDDLIQFNNISVL